MFRACNLAVPVISHGLHRYCGGVPNSRENAQQNRLLSFHGTSDGLVLENMSFSHAPRPFVLVKALPQRIWLLCLFYLLSR